MANHLYGYASSKYGASPEKSASAASLYAAASLSLTDTYLSRRYLSASDPLASSDLAKWNSSSASSSSSSSSSSMYLNLSLRDSSSAAAASHLSSWPPPPPPGVDVDSLIPGIKRSSDALYHQTILGSHNTIGLSESWYSTNSLAKRSRLEIASNLSLYPQRPGEKDCAHYMLTRTCKFGDSCKFDHPVWVPEGGIPDWKEVPVFATSEYLPDRPGEPDCPYFLKTQRCKYGFKCKFNHPKGTLGALENIDTSALPERPSEPPCAFYMKTGKCKYGATCKFHHPKDILIQENGNGEKSGSAVTSEGTMGNVNVVAAFDSFTPAPYYNSKGLPIRLGEVDCPFYLKTGSCKYGATCRYNHPDRNAVGHSILTPTATSLNIGVVNPAASIYQAIDPLLAQPTLVVGTTLYPQRPGQTECDYYMKTGECKFGERCKFHHPIDRSASTTKPGPQETFKLTLAGLPRREGAVHCPYYMKTGTCRYGATCKFDHPPPAEVMAIAASQGTSSSAGVQDAGAV